MKHRVTLSVSFKEIAWLAACTALIAGAFLYAQAEGRAPLASVETRFVETSASGLQIIPASCPSNPHNDGSCSNTGACNIFFSQSPIAQGATTNVNWWYPSSATEQRAGVVGILSYPGGSHPVNPIGNGPVGGDQTKTYTLSYSIPTDSGGTLPVSCSATLVVCASGQIVQNGQCVDQGTSCTAVFTPATIAFNGSSVFTWSGQNAGTLFYPGGSNPVPASGSGNVGGGVVGPRTYRFVDSKTGGQCEATLMTCPAGYTVNGTNCVAPGGQCTQQYYCQGNNLYQRTVQCTDQFVQACAWGCAGGGCYPPPAPSGNITASPALIHSGKTSQITWSAENVTACTVTENNGDINDSWTGKSGTHVSSILAQQTVYTLRCTGVDGTELVDSVIVNIIPDWEEQ